MLSRTKREQDLFDRAFGPEHRDCYVVLPLSLTYKCVCVCLEWLRLSTMGKDATHGCTFFLIMMKQIANFVKIDQSCKSVY